MTFKLNLQNTLIIFFSIILAVTVYLGFLTYRNNLSFKSSNQWVQRTEAVLIKVHEVSTLSKDLQLSNSAYILSGNSGFLKMYKESRAAMVKNMSLLDKLTSNSPLQHRRLDSLEKYVSALIRYSDESLVRDRTTFRLENDFLGLQMRKKFQDEINAYLAMLLKEERRVLNGHEEENARNIARSNTTFVILSFFVLLLLISSFLVVVYHLRKRREAEDALRESEAGFRSILNSVKDYAIFRIDKSGRIMNWSLGAQHIKGYTFEEIRGKNISVFYTPEDREKGMPEHCLDMAAKNGKFETEGWRVRKDGGRFWANVLITAIYDEKGEVCGFTKVTRDDTLRKKAEEEIRNALEREKELGEMKSNFIAIASHEFKTPLSIILTSAALVARYKSPEFEEKRNRELKRIIASTKNMNTIIDEFLSLQKIEEGKAETRIEDFNLKDFTESLCAQMKGIAKQGQEIVYSHEGTEIVASDPVVTRQILTNLVSNAIKYSPENVPIYVSTYQVNGRIQIRVQDEGIGISEDDQKHLFERFFRASNVAEVKGTGLGLHITKRYAELLNGSISVESYPGKGSVFIVNINPK